MSPSIIQPALSNFNQHGRHDAIFYMKIQSVKDKDSLKVKPYVHKSSQFTIHNMCMHNVVSKLHNSSSTKSVRSSPNVNLDHEPVILN